MGQDVACSGGVAAVMHSWEACQTGCTAGAGGLQAGCQRDARRPTWLWAARGAVATNV
jgi:hypothetical protein